MSRDGSCGDVLAIRPGLPRAATVDADRVAALVSLMGPNRVLDLFENLALRLERIAATLDGKQAPAPATLALIHQAKGAAGSLGLSALHAILHHDAQNSAAFEDRDTLVAAIAESRRRLQSIITSLLSRM